MHRKLEKDYTRSSEVKKYHSEKDVSKLKILPFGTAESIFDRIEKKMRGSKL